MQLIQIPCWLCSTSTWVPRDGPIQWNDEPLCCPCTEDVAPGLTAFRLRTAAELRVEHGLVTNSGAVGLKPPGA